MLSGNEKLYDELISRFEKHGATDIQKINAQFDQSCPQLAALSWDQLLECGAAFGTTLVLDAVACHAASYATTQAGRAFVQTVSELLSAPQAQAAEHMLEIAGLGKIALDEGANWSLKITQKNTSSTTPQPSSPMKEIMQQASYQHTQLFSKLKSLGNNVWESPAGIVYGPDKNFGNRLQHVLSHTTSAGVNKKSHSVFSLPPNQIIDLVDQAWLLKKTPLSTDPGSYVVNLNKVIGTAGETFIKIVVVPGTSKLITAYPIL